LITMRLENFKGIKNLLLELNGQNASIWGDNAVGKTSICDAYLWLLFGKDSQDKSDFAIKPLGSTGEAVHNIESSVEGTFEINSKIFSLKKVYSEKWTQKRGHAKKDFTGHTTDFYVDGIPKQKKEYELFIKGLINEDLFRILSNPSAFNEQLKWQDRRNILLEVAGDLTDEEVIASDKKLAKLPDILNGRALDDYRKIIAARKATINKELEKIPVRINESQRGLPDIAGLNAKQLAEDIPNLKASIKENEQKLLQIESGGEVAEKQTKLKIIESELLDIKNNHREKQDKLIDDKRQELSSAKTHNADIQSEVNLIARNVQNKQAEIDAITKILNNLRDQWQAANKLEFAFEQSDTCPTCNRPLPEEELQEAREKALANFNVNKAERIETINTDGKQGKEHLTELNTEITQLKDDHEKASNNFMASSEQVSKLQAELNNLMGVNPESIIEYADKLKEKYALEKAIEQATDKLKEGTFTERYTIQTEIDRLEVALLATETSLNSIKQNEQGQERIKELEAQEHDLAAEYEKLEGELFLCEQFVVAKVGMLEEKINSRFKLAKFKLFETQINEGIKECCETTVNGVPYSGGLNNAMRIAVGLEIIGVLSEYYGFSAPVFIDNCEAITKLPEMQCQVIALYVSEPDKVLRVEIKKEDK